MKEQRVDRRNFMLLSLLLLRGELTACYIRYPPLQFVTAQTHLNPTRPCGRRHGASLRCLRMLYVGNARSSKVQYSKSLQRGSLIGDILNPSKPFEDLSCYDLDCCTKTGGLWCVSAPLESRGCDTLLEFSVSAGPCSSLPFVKECAS